MTVLNYSIAEDIFKRHPGYVRGVVTVCGVRNGPSPEPLQQLMREAEEALRGTVQPDAVAAHPRIAAWREAYRSFGANPGEFRSSVEAMARRVLRGQSLPAINTLVDIGNLVSLRHLLPAGSHAMDTLRGNIELRTASGREEFIPFGSDRMEHPLPGEIIFAEGDAVLVRRWTWRQANHTLTLQETMAVEFNVDGLPPASPADVDLACGEIAELVKRFCGGRIGRGLLSEAHPVMALPAEIFPPAL